MKRIINTLIFTLVLAFFGLAYTEAVMATTDKSVVASDSQQVSFNGEELIIISPFISDHEYEMYLPETQITYEDLRNNGSGH